MVRCPASLLCESWAVFHTVFDLFLTFYALTKTVWSSLSLWYRIVVFISYFFFFTFAVNYSLNSLQLFFKTFQRAHVETDTAQNSTRRLSSVVSLITTYTGPLPNHLGFLLSIINVSLLFGSSLPSALKIIQGSRFLSAHFFLAFHRHQPLHWLSSLRPFL